MITYHIPKEEFVKITVSDELGREVRVLENKLLQAGSYSAEFNSNGLASGIYFYTIEAGEFVQTKKMTLLK